MKHFFKKKSMFFLMGLLLLMFCYPMQGRAAAKYLNFSTSVPSKTTIKLSWSKKSVSGYDIYRAEIKSDGAGGSTTGEFKRIATISGKKTSYTDKVTYKKKYGYKVIGYKKSGKKKVTKYAAYKEEYAGMGDTYWGEYLHSDGMVSPEAIYLDALVDNGMDPTGFLIYRSDGTSGFKRIAKVEPTKYKGYIEYTDKKVTAGATYKYRVRAYKKIGKTTLLGKYSDELFRSATNQSGKYKVQSLTEPNQTVSDIVLGITSDKYNGETVFSHNLDCLITKYYCDETDETDLPELRIAKYSYDNKEWRDLTEEGEEVVLKAGETLYLMLEGVNGTTFNYKGIGEAASGIRGIGVSYNRLYSSMDIDLAYGEGLACVDLERYH